MEETTTSAARAATYACSIQLKLESAESSLQSAEAGSSRPSARLGTRPLGEVPQVRRPCCDCGCPRSEPTRATTAARGGSEGSPQVSLISEADWADVPEVSPCTAAPGDSPVRYQ